MVELSFLKSGSKYICEFEVSSDFNLHIEREKGGYLFLYQRSSEGGNYDSVGDAKFAPQDLVVDYDCSALVYPKYIKIVSEVEPSYAAITTDGEVTEIKSQSKEVEIVANGVTEITPDAGFGYLSGVKVNVNVPQSGGGESGGGGGAASGGSNMKYIDIRAMDELDAAQVAMFAYCVAGLTEDNTFVAIPLTIEMLMPIDTNKRFAVSIPWDAYVYMNGAKMQAGPAIDAQFGSKLKYLTEEEFYNPATFA